MTKEGFKWKMGVPELIIIVSLIIALATTMNMKASSNDLARMDGRITVLEGQYNSILANQIEMKEILKAIDTKQRDVLDRIARMEEVHGVKAK